MEGLLVFDQHNYIILNQYNQLFTTYLYEFAHRSGFQTDHPDYDSQNEIFRDLLSVLLTPFVASQRYLRDNSKITLDCFENAKAVFSKRQELFFLLIFGDEENENFMQRKIDVFAQIIQFIFGPSMQSIKLNDQIVVIALKMFEKWKQLNKTMTFMLESTERLLIGSDLNTTCNKTLENILSTIRSVSKSFSNEIPSHVYLFHGLKYITTYSSRNSGKISRRDMLLMLLLSHAIDNQTVLSEANKLHVIINNNNNSDKVTDIEGIEKGRAELAEKDDHCQQLIIFLQTNNDPNLMFPYVFKKLNIAEDLFAIILSEIPSKLGMNLSIIINIINTLINEPDVKRCCHTVIQLQKSMKNIKDYCYNNNLINNKSYFPMLNNLSKLSKSKVFEYITDFDEKILSLQLENQLELINCSLRESYKNFIFEDYYKNNLSSKSIQFNHIYNEVQLYCKKTFNPYLDYFKVKSLRNMTLLGINIDIKDLIGFVYIDRTVNELIIAPIECTDSYSDDSEHIDLNDFSLNQLYSNHLNIRFVNMINNAYDCLINGNLMTSWSDDKFYYNYSIWFEDSSGTTLKPLVKTFKLKSYPSIINGNYIQEIINMIFTPEYNKLTKCEISLNKKSRISCYPYELFCIYRQTFDGNETNLTENRNQLSSKLWEIGISTDI